MRRANPDRIREAQCAGIRARLMGEWRQTEKQADALLEAWDAIAADRGLDPDSNAYRSEREAWLRERVTSG